MARRGGQAGEVGEAAVGLDGALVAGDESAKIAEPGEGSLDFPAAAAAPQTATVLTGSPVVADVASFSLIPMTWLAMNPAGCARIVLRGKKSIPRWQLAFAQAMAWICLVGVTTLLFGAWLAHSY